eukprot:13875801-Alexandrium_andersonii.AAC.1
MSASLVGSEMCIRDRQSAALGRITLHQSSFGCEAAVCSAICTRPIPRVSCLLYTSDAADDM